jgi:hypothetical protein
MTIKVHASGLVFLRGATENDSNCVAGDEPSIPCRPSRLPSTRSQLLTLIRVRPDSHSDKASSRI